ncbi:MAG: hypothetical protein B6242_08580 [Anaerolineaceae bacterium 4572_78]|nr:MAG: hypothetical protein B6242_08580 [Anaerolineaceae bacterium 4572_78]
MAIKFESAAESYAAVAVMIVTSDKEYSMAEGHQIWVNIVKDYSVFEGHNFTELQDKVLNMFNKNDMNTPFTPEEVSTIVSATKEILNPELRQQVYEMAVSLSKSDNVGQDVEEKILTQLKNELL